MSPSSLAVSPPFRLDFLAGTMLALVGGLGLVVLRYSRSYLAGDPGLPRYRRWLLATLAAVAVLVCANDLLLIAAAWTALSLTLQPLLTHHGERTAARLAAHKKFLVSRLADLALWPALAIAYAEAGSLRLDRLAAWTAAHPGLTPAMQLAAVLLVLAAVLRTAQLPFHGWLLQVMDAPTPVSALLHAGVVNVGGFVLVRLSPLLAQAPVARAVLLGFGLVTAGVAALVMTTRVSVKVALAWSTCAQMGFMLVEIALGLTQLALLHLVAHSLYKAHAFLSAGGAVERWRVQALAPRSRTMRAPCLVALGGAYLSVHLVASRLVPLPAPGLTGPWAWTAVAIALAALAGARWALARQGRFARALQPRLFAGLHLDDHFTRWAFRLWPPRLCAGRAPALRLQPALEPRALGTDS